MIGPDHASLRILLSMFDRGTRSDDGRIEVIAGDVDITGIVGASRSGQLLDPLDVRVNVLLLLGLTVAPGTIRAIFAREFIVCQRGGVVSC
ncbi:hypothetical protein N136_00091 [Leifsonia aquatica ATCC 14665]|uniref:Uncharacterized protein n=1 Tax=Leifsonia aquatica ATCC 14665 TaxID=1358026 RepID=U2T7T7_LEIAQ|nr:hypothetical protein N136_00091 [Leifsonia aquatica ATCC 14665]